MSSRLPANKARPNSRQLRDVLEDHDFDPVSELVTLAQNEDSTNRLRYEISRTFLEYLFAKKKSVSVETEQTSPIKFNMQLGDKEGTKNSE